MKLTLTFLLAAATAALVSASPHPDDKQVGDTKPNQVQAKCFSGCSSVAAVESTTATFSQAMIVESPPRDFPGFCDTWYTFSVIAKNTRASWQQSRSVQFQTVQTEFRQMVDAGASVFRGFKNGCNICDPTFSNRFTDVAYIFFTTMQTVISTFVGRYQPYLNQCSSHFGILRAIIQAVVGIAYTLRVDISRLIQKWEIDCQLFQFVSIDILGILSITVGGLFEDIGSAISGILGRPEQHSLGFI